MTTEALLERAETELVLAVELSFDLARVARQWEELEQGGSAFQTRAWLLPWYRLIAPKFGAVPLFVIVRDLSSGRPLMFFPLCLRRKLELVTIEFPDLGVSDYNAPIVSSDLVLTDDQAQKLWEDILRSMPPADLVRFDKVPEMIAGRPNPIARFDWLRRMELRAWSVELPATREEYDNRVLRRRDRKEHRRKRRHLIDSLGDVALVVGETESQRREIFQGLRNEREKRFKKCRRCDILSDPIFLRFYETVAFDEGGSLASLFALKTEDRVVATLFALHHDDRYLLLMHCFETGLELLSPGIVAIDELITYLIEFRAKFCDLTIGNEPYKHQFGVEESFLYQGMCALTRKGQLYIQARNLLRRTKRIIILTHSICRSWARRCVRAKRKVRS